MNKRRRHQEIPLHRLEIPDKNKDEDLKIAIKIANKFLSTSEIEDIFTKKFMIDWAKCIEQSSHVQVVYSDNHGGGSERDLAWTNRQPNQDLRTIFINHRFGDRLATLNRESTDKCDQMEREIIVFFVAILLIHEMAHLVIRWTYNKPNTPKKLGLKLGGKPEAGLFMESRLFKDVIYINIDKKPWTAQSKVKGVHVKGGKNLDEMVQISNDFISKVYNGSLNSVEDYLDFEYDHEAADIQGTYSIKKCGHPDDESSTDDESRPRRSIDVGVPLLNKCGT